MGVVYRWRCLDFRYQEHTPFKALLNVEIAISINVNIEIVLNFLFII